MTKKIVGWTINVEWSDGTKENISDIPNQVSQEVDAYLTEVENDKNKN